MLMRFAGRLGTVAAIMTLGCVAPTTAHAQVYKCKDAAGKAIYDTSEMHIRYLGPCKTDMRPGDVFLVQDDGRLVKQR